MPLNIFRAWGVECRPAKRFRISTMTMSAISLTLSAKSPALHPRSQLLSTRIWLLIPSMPPSIALAHPFSLYSHLTLFTSHLLSSFVCCCWGAHLRSRSFHYHNERSCALAACSYSWSVPWFSAKQGSVRQQSCVICSLGITPHNSCQHIFLPFGGCLIINSCMT